MERGRALFLGGGFLFGFIISGSHAGFYLAILPAYIAEITPVKFRGTLGAVPGTNLTLGILVAVIIGIPVLMGTADLWIYIFWLQLIPIITVIFALPFCPDSPRFLYLTKQLHGKARSSLVWLRGTHDVDDEMALIASEQNSDATKKSMSILAVLKDPFLRKLTVIVFVLLFIQQFSGISGMFIYSSAIFGAAGLGKSQSIFASIGLMAVQVVVLLVTVVITDKVGRRPLILFGHLGTIISSCLMVLFMSLQKSGGCESCSYGTVVATFSFIILHNLGPAFISWVVVPEMFEQTTRSAAMMIAVLTSNASGLVIAFVFPVISSYIGQWIMLIFAGISSIGLIFLYFKLVETKGKDFLTVQTELRQKFT